MAIGWDIIQATTDSRWIFLEFTESVGENEIKGSRFNSNDTKKMH